MLLFVTAVGVVLVVSFLCSIFESVLLSLTPPQVEVLAQRKQRAGILLARFKENIDVPIAAILILNTAAHTIGAAVAGASYADAFSANTLWLFSIVFTLAVLLFTEIIPKTLGVTYAPKLATPVAWGIHWLTVILRPLVALSERISQSLRGGAEAPITSPEEIRLLAWLGRRKGVVGDTTAGMIVGAAQLRYLKAQDVMLPREDVRFLSAEMCRDEVVRLIHDSGHSRFPFSPTGDLKDVTGVVLSKELLYWLLHNDGDTIDWPTLTRELLAVPPSVSLIQLQRTFQRTQRHLAVIIDEYGSFEGIVTLEDVLEEIVGDIFDESDLPIADMDELGDGSLIVSARVDLRKLSAHLGIAWDTGSPSATVGGLITETLERIPVAGDSIRWHGYRIDVLRADGRRVKLLRVSPDVDTGDDD